MFLSRRKSERRPCREASRVKTGVGSLPRDCMITDMSDGGLKLVIENVDLPPEFTVILSSGQQRYCRLAWRIGCEFGAEFISVRAA